VLQKGGICFEAVGRQPTKQDGKGIHLYSPYGSYGEKTLQ